jgi:hypothetical protein
VRPTALELITYLDGAYNNQILPELTDPYVRNRANILNQIIGALHQRWRLEGPMLVADNDDLRQLLSGAISAVPGVDIPGVLERSEALRPGPHEYQTIECLTAVNNELRQGLVDLINSLGLHAEDGLKELERRVDQYLRRQLDRELEICAAPVFGEGEGIGRRPDLPRA